MPTTTDRGIGSIADFEALARRFNVPTVNVHLKWTNETKYLVEKTLCTGRYPDGRFYLSIPTVVEHSDGHTTFGYLHALQECYDENWIGRDGWMQRMLYVDAEVLLSGGVLETRRINYAKDGTPLPSGDWWTKTSMHPVSEITGSKD